jgi:hypothetical protein
VVKRVDGMLLRMYSGLFMKKKDFFYEHILANFDLSKIAQGRFETDGEVERKDLTAGTAGLHQCSWHADC